MLDALRWVAKPARLARGCTRAQVLSDVDGADAIEYVEEWQTTEDLQERIRTASFSQLLAVMETAPAEPSFEVRTISEVRGLQFVAEVREPSPTVAEGHVPHE
jgi:quinol monooxygenase YgiN